MSQKHNLLADLFQNFADQNRLKLLTMISSESEKYCVDDLRKALKVTQPAVSRHFKILRDYDIVTLEKRGLNAFYKINQAKLEKYRGKMNAYFKELLGK